jgi:GR25 family glycosyltransferase involved in LPS biosynthesis
MTYKIIVINLKKREDRKNNIIKLFDEINFEKYYFYEAIDGKTIPLTLEIKNLFKDNDFTNRKCFIGCALSHYNIWLDLAKDKLNNYYLIFEDDIQLSDNFIKNFNKCKEYVDQNIENIDILFLGYHKNSITNKIYNYNNISFTNFCNEEYVGGFFSYIITKKGVFKLLEYIKKNGIKYGIDYLIKIYDKLNVLEVNPNIVYSEWVRNLSDDIDTNIQKDFEIFDFNQILDYNNFLFIKNYDQINNDYKYVNSCDINYLLDISRGDNINISGFNTLGFIKNKINLQDLKIIDFFKNNNHGIYINMNKKINIKVLCNWCTSQILCEEWNVMSKGNYTWNNIRITYEDNNIDYYIIINKPYDDNEKYIEEKTIIFQMEPYCNNEYQNWGIKTWGKWANPDESKFLEVRTHKKFYNNCMWQLNSTYKQFMEKPIIKKYNYISTICSSKYYDPGHIKRVDFLKFLENKNDLDFKIDIYGNDNKLNFKNYIKSLDTDKKNDGILPYKYYFMVENNFEYNYISEKLWEPIISECLCFYCGAPNVDDYIDRRAYIILNLDDFEESYNIIKNAITNDLWSERINIIREEKYKILNYYNFFPTVERIITKDLLKNNINNLILPNIYTNSILLSDTSLKKFTKIYILQTENILNHKIIPFIDTLKYFGFDVNIFNKINKENIIIQNIIGSEYEKKLIHLDSVKYCNLSNNLDINKLCYTWNKIKLYEELLLDNAHNYLILDDNIEFISSFYNLINHLLYLPINYDVCLLYESKKNPYKLINQHNLFYYNIKKYFFDSLHVEIISKEGIIKILKYINNFIPFYSKHISYECYENINNFNLYSVNGNQLFHSENEKI